MSPRLTEPVLTIHQNKDKGRPKKHSSRTLKIMAGISVDRLPVMWIPYKYLSDEKKEIFKAQSVANYSRYYHTKGRFRRHVKRQASIRYYEKTHDSKKVCIYCKEEKSLGHFDKRQDKRLGKYVYRSYCYTCRSQKNKEDYVRRKQRKESS